VADDTDRVRAPRASSKNGPDLLGQLRDIREWERIVEANPHLRGRSWGSPPGWDKQGR
jgi:hypothetical protein